MSNEWDKLYEKYDIKKKTSYKNITVILLIIVFISALFAFFLLRENSITINEIESFELDNNVSSISKIKFSYEYIDNVFVFYVNNTGNKILDSFETYFDGNKTEYIILNGDLPIQKNSLISFKINEQLCDKEHTITIKTVNSENKIITYPLVCANIIT